MAIISSSLQKRVDNAPEPDAKHKVLISFNEQADVQQLDINGRFIIDNLIMSAELTKEEIERLSANPGILAIEEDGEMNIL